jgi:phospholipid/cholesterol/gamma-HCH transport system substrate-binding protein
VAPPIVRGRQLLKQRLFGLLFLGVLAGLIALTIAQYNKYFADTVEVTLEADRIGNQLGKGADVKARGLLVGEVRSVESDADGARIRLALQRDKLDQLPSDVQARLLPKTLFGEKFVSLVVDGDTDAPPLQEGDVIPQDRSQTSREFTTALDNALPLLQTLKPEQVSLTLNALSSALRGRGERIGENATLVRDYLREFNPELPTLAEDFEGVADLSDTLTASSEDFLQVFDDLSEVNRDLVETRDELDAFLQASTGVSGTVEDFLQDNEQRFITLARESGPNLRTYARYSPQFTCMSQALVDDHERISDSFGNLQPGLHITLEFTDTNGPYLVGDEPEYTDDAGPTCRSLGRGPRERPMPEYRDGTDGYRDGQPVFERTGKRAGPPP